MSRHTTFKLCLDPTAEQHLVLSRHVGAARFAFNQCLRIVKTSLTLRKVDADCKVPWSGYDLINEFNTWKKSEDAGRVFKVDYKGVASVQVTGLRWRTEVRQQVFEEAAIDCGRALAAWSDSRAGKRKGRRVGFPRFKKKAGGSPTFRLRNKQGRNGRPLIRVGEAHARSVTLPGIGTVRVHDDTRRLRRMLAKGRMRILFATVYYRAGRWWVSLNTEAADLHPAHRHPLRADGDSSGWIGVDRGLSALLVAANSAGTEVARVDAPPKALAAGMRRQQHLAKSLSRKQKGSKNRKNAAARLARHHHRVANVRQHFLQQATNALVKTHDRLVIEDLNVAGLLRNHCLARAISDASWGDFARMLRYKTQWRSGTLQTADRWYPSSKRCSVCGAVNSGMTLADRVFTCSCGHRSDRDVNAASNLATWGEDHARSVPRTPKQEAGSTMPADVTARPIPLACRQAPSE